jgi:hypothetical protein
MILGNEDGVRPYASAPAPYPNSRTGEADDERHRAQDLVRREAFAARELPP